MKNLISLLMGITLLCVVSCAWARKSADPAPQASLEHDVKKKSTLKVMSYNIHHCNPPSKAGFIDVEAIVRTIKNQAPDVVALQEVDVHTGRSGNIDQAKAIAEGLGMHYYFGKAIDHDGGEYGVAILSKYPISEQVVHKLPTLADTKGEPRVLTTVKITLSGNKAIKFASTHLDAQKSPVNRKAQIDEIARLTASEKLPFIIAGDFNAAPDSEVIQLLDKQFTRTCQNCAPTIPVINPTKAIDFIAFSPASKFQVSQHEVISETYASDHLPVVAVLSIK